MEGQRSYYVAALTALRYAEERSPTGRCFGKEADAAWRGFKGGLTATDRIDLLLRNAHGQWRDAFGARPVYALRAVHEEEPFGPEWESLSTRAAENLWREVNGAEAPRTVKAALRDCASAWDITLKKVVLQELRPTTKVLLVGPSAVAGYAAHFAEESSLTWARQVQCIATPPGHRQLAFLAGAIVNSSQPAEVFTAQEATLLKRPRLVVVSADADPADAAAAEGSGS